MLIDRNIINATDYTVPSTRLCAWCLGIDYTERRIAQISASVFPQSPQELIVMRLAAEMNRAYIGNTDTLTAANLAARVRRIIPEYYFQLDLELQQCADCCIPIYGDDLSPATTLFALEGSRYLNNRFQTPFSVILVIEVLARLVKFYDKLRYKLHPLCYSILFNSYVNAVEDIQFYINDEKAYWQAEEAANVM